MCVNRLNLLSLAPGGQVEDLLFGQKVHLNNYIIYLDHMIIKLFQQ